MIAHTSHRSASTTALRNASRILDNVSQSLDQMEQRAAQRKAQDARWRRSIALAERAGQGPWSVRFISLEIGRDGWPTRVEVEAPSASVPFLWHRVSVDLRAGSATCGCVAATFGKPCRHIGSAALYGVQVVRAYEEASAEYAAQRRAEDRASAIAPSL